MLNKIKNFPSIVLLSVLPTLFIWFPFFFRVNRVWGIPLPQEGMATIVANYDGPFYIVVAKTLYNPSLLNNFTFSLPAKYYAAHFPLFPLAIKLFAFPFGFPYSMLFVTLFSSILATYFFYIFISDYVSKKDVLWLTLVFSIFPARWLIVRSVGSPEPLFLSAIIASVYYFKKKRLWHSAIWGSVAVAIKSPGILLFIAYFLAIYFPKLKKAATTTFSRWVTTLEIRKYLPLTLLPLTLVAIFSLYKVQFNDFLAYFHSGDNIHLFFPPFQIFNYSQPWVGTFWLEEVIFVYLFGVLGLIRLIKQKDFDVAWFVGLFFFTTLFVSHRDLIRYSLPIVPFIIASFAQEITKKEFKYAIALLIIPIYLYSLAYISQNVMPIPDWAPLL